MFIATLPESKITALIADVEATRNQRDYDEKLDTLRRWVRFYGVTADQHRSLSAQRYI